jgi:hypothetical protein
MYIGQRPKHAPRVSEISIDSLAGNADTEGDGDGATISGGDDGTTAEAERQATAASKMTTVRAMFMVI